MISLVRQNGGSSGVSIHDLSSSADYRRVQSAVASLEEIVNRPKYEKDSMTESIRDWWRKFQKSLQSDPNVKRKELEYMILLAELLQNPLGPLDEDSILGSDGYTYGRKQLCVHLNRARGEDRFRSPLDPLNPGSFTTTRHEIVCEMVIWLKRWLENFPYDRSDPAFSEIQRLVSNEEVDIAYERLKGQNQIPILPTVRSEAQRRIAQIKSKRDKEKLEEEQGEYASLLEEALILQKESAAQIEEQIRKTRRVFQEINEKIEALSQRDQERLVQIQSQVNVLKEEINALDQQNRELDARQQELGARITELQQDDINLQKDINEVRIAIKKRNQKWIKDVLIAVGTGMAGWGTTFLLQEILQGLQIAATGDRKHHRSAPVVTVYQAPPQPKTTPVSYAIGLVIRALQKHPVAGGDYVGTDTGGIGQTTFTTSFSSTNHALSPYITVSVWKKDFHAAQISTLTTERANLETERAALQSRKDELIRRVDLIAQEVLANTQKVNQKTPLVTTLDKEISDLSASQTKLQQEMEGVKREIVKEGKKLQSLSKFLDLNASLKLGIDISHNSLQEFNKNKAAILALAESQGEEDPFLAEIVANFQEVAEVAKKASGKDVVALVGPTGTGKSTIINHLLNVKIVSTPNGRVKVENEQEEVTKIGQSVTGSQTLFAEVCNRAGSSLTFLDCGGFNDTRGPRTDLQVAASVKNSLSTAKSTKIILCVNSSVLDGRSAVVFLTAAIKEALNKLIKTYSAYPDSFMLILTQPQDELSTQDALKDLQEILDELAGKEDEALYKFILREGGKYVHVYDPLSDASRQQVQKVIGEMKGIPSSANPFSITYSDEAKRELLTSIVTIGQRGVDLFKQYQAKKEALEKVVDSLGQKTKAKSDLQKEIKDLQADSQTKNATKAKHQTDANTLDPQITAKNTAIAGKTTAINGLNTQELLVYTYANNKWMAPT